MRELRRKPKMIGKRDPAKSAAASKRIREALVRNLNANVLKDAAERSSKPPEDINKSGGKNDKRLPE
jgi:hypothetical protein